MEARVNGGARNAGWAPASWREERGTDRFCLISMTSRRYHMDLNTRSTGERRNDGGTPHLQDELRQRVSALRRQGGEEGPHEGGGRRDHPLVDGLRRAADDRSEEHTSELQSREKLVCRLLRE